MKTVETVKYTLICIALVVCGIFLITSKQPRVKSYDCSLAEISPDYPVEVKNMCRKFNSETFKKGHGAS